MVASGLSMPHSPRWYRGRLWVLESGDGSLGWVDRRHGRVRDGRPSCPASRAAWTSTARYAFIGLSQVRETAVFSGIPITERLTERICGVWVVDLRDGRIVAFLRFEAGVQEIFAVQVLAGIRFPEVLPDDDKVIAESFALPEEALQQVPAALRS